MASPYADLPIEMWRDKTIELIQQHPLDIKVIRAVALESWEVLWSSKIGRGKTSIPLDQIDVPSIVVGYFFEKLFARELQLRFPGEWRGTESKDEKDLVYLPDSRYSTEMKTSGQLALKIFGNRSYSQVAENEALISKLDRSGYYISVNFWRKTLTLIQFGWIDSADWVPQASSTGQAASLSPGVYRHKLIPIPGEYRLNAPVQLLAGVGEKTAGILALEKVRTLRDLLGYGGESVLIQRLRDQVKNSGLVE